MVIVVIGIIAAIGVPAIVNITETADTGGARRNAQSICSLYNGARSAGVEFSSAAEAGIIDELVAGVGGGDIAGSNFKLSGLSAAEKTEAMEYCSYDISHDLMVYHPEGGQSMPVPGPWIEVGVFVNNQVAAYIDSQEAAYPDREYTHWYHHDGHSTISYRVFS